MEDRELVEKAWSLLRHIAFAEAGEYRRLFELRLDPEAKVAALAVRSLAREWLNEHRKVHPESYV